MKIVIPDPIWGIPEKYWDQLRGLGADVYKELPTDQKSLSLTTWTATGSL